MHILQIDIIPSSVLIELGPLQMRYYGLFIALGVVLGLVIATKIGKAKKLDTEIIFDLILYGAISGILGGRVLHVVSNLSYYINNPKQIIAVWNGGLSLHGGLFLGALTIAVYLYKKKINIWKYLDVIAPAMVFAQALGRWGNFFNQEAFGLPTSLPWGIYIEKMYRPLEYVSYQYFHPTFFYEFIANSIIFVVLIVLHKKKLIDGEITLIYLISYSFFRFFIEILRTDSVYIGTMKLEQILSIAIIIIASMIIYYRRQHISK